MAGEGGLNVGRIFASLGFSATDDDQIAKWKRDRDRAEQQAKRPVKQPLGFDVDDAELKRYRAELEKVRAQAKRKEDLKVKLGADFDESAFRQFERATERAHVQALKAKASTKSFSDELDGLSVKLPKVGSVMGLLKWPAMIAGAGLATQAFSALTAGAVALGSALAPIAGAAAAYPALGSAAAQGLGTWKLATAGLGEAVGGLNEKIDTTSKAFKNLSPEAQTFAKHLDSLKPSVREIQRSAQQGLFPGLDKGLTDASKNLPIFNKIAGETGKALGGIGEQAGKMLGSKAWGKDFETQGARNTKWIKELGDAGLHLVDALRHVVIAAGPLTDWLVKGVDHFAKLTDEQAKAGRESGKLAGFFDETRIAISRVVRIGADLATAFFNIAKQGKPLGDDILVNLVKVADHFRKWTDSARGQNAIAQYFRDAKAPIHELGLLVHDIGVDFFNLGKGNQLAPMIRTIRVDLLPRFVDLVDSTTKAFGPPMLEAIKQVAILFTKLGGTNGPLTMLVTLVGKIAGGINKATDAIPGLGSAISSLGTAASLYAALRIGASLSGLTRVIRLIKDVRKATAVTGAVEVATGAGSAAAGGAAAGGAAAGAARTGVVAAVVTKLPIAAIGAAIAAAIAAAIPKTKAHRKLTDFFDFDSTKLDDQVDALDKFNKAVARLNATGDKKGADKLTDQFLHLKNAAHGLGSVKDIDRLTRSANDLADAGGTLNRTIGRDLDRAAAHFADFRRTGSNSLAGLHRATADNMSFIKRTLGADSAAGKEALARNFRLVRTAVRQAMDDGKVSVRDGLAEIQRLMRAELKTYGITGGVASSIIKHGDIKAGGGAGAGKARGGWINRARHAVGGWIGQRGMVSGDVVPIAPGALAAYGEYDAHSPSGGRAIINRHQAPVVDAALAAGGYPDLDRLPGGRQLPIIERALAPMGGLDRLFSAITRPHHLAGGGRFQPGGAVLSFDQLKTLWVEAGGAPGMAAIMAHVALAESGGSTTAHNPSGAAGLWQILGALVPGNLYDPLVNARNAVRKLATQGLDGAWISSKGGPNGWGRFLSDPNIAGAPVGGATTPLVPATASPISAPQTGSLGVLGTIVQATLNRVATGATARVQDLLDAAGATASPGGGAAGGPAGTALFKGVTMAKWVAAALQYAQTKGVQSQPTSGYRPGFDPHTASGTSEHQGLQYPHGAVDFGSFTSGLGPKLAVVNATRDFKWPLLAPIGFRDDGHASGTGHALGGIIQRFASGGRKKKPLVAPKGKVTATAQPKTLATKPLAKLQTTRIADYDALSGDVADLETLYSQQERVYDQTDEVLIDPDTGALNVDQIKHRAQEISGLINTQQAILRKRNQMKAIADRVVKTFQTIISRLKTSLTYARKKDRSGIRGQISQYGADLKTWGDSLHQLVVQDLPNSRLDLSDLVNERASVLGTQAQPVDPGDSDTGGPGSAGDDTTTAPPSSADIAAAAYQDVQNYLSGQRDLLTSFASNAYTQRQAYAPGGVFSGSPDLEGAALGALRGFGGGANLAGSLGMGGGGPGVGQLIVNFAQPPADGPTLVQQLRFQVENGGVS